MPLLACTITAEARAILHAAGGLALLPLFATAEMRAHIDLRALTNLHMGKLSVNIGLTLEYATALKNLDAALKAETPAFVELMDEAAASYVPGQSAQRSQHRVGDGAHEGVRAVV